MIRPKAGSPAGGCRLFAWGIYGLVQGQGTAAGPAVLRTAAGELRSPVPPSGRAAACGRRSGFCRGTEKGTRGGFG